MNPIKADGTICAVDNCPEKAVISETYAMFGHTVWVSWCGEHLRGRFTSGHAADTVSLDEQPSKWDQEPQLSEARNEKAGQDGV